MATPDGVVAPVVGYADRLPLAELAAALEVLRLQRIPHVPQRLRQPPDLVVPLRRGNLTLQILLSNLVRGQRQLPERTQRKTRDQNHNTGEREQQAAEVQRRDPAKRPLPLEKFGFVRPDDHAPARNLCGFIIHVDAARRQRFRVT